MISLVNMLSSLLLLGRLIGVSTVSVHAHVHDSVRSPSIAGKPGTLRVGEWLLTSDLEIICCGYLLMRTIPATNSINHLAPIPSLNDIKGRPALPLSAAPLAGISHIEAAGPGERHRGRR